MACVLHAPSLVTAVLPDIGSMFGVFCFFFFFVV
jgi:hypothetical protein